MSGVITLMVGLLFSVHALHGSAQMTLMQRSLLHETNTQSAERPIMRAIIRIVQTQAPTSGTQIYTNHQYGFSIRHPAAMSPGTTDYAAGHPFASMPVVYFAADDGAQTEGYVTVNVSSAASDLAACLQPGSFDDNKGQTKLIGASQVKIGAASFLRSERSDGGGPLGLELDYTNIHEKSCYDIQVVSYPSACVNSGCTDRQWSLRTETALLSKLDSLAQSFAFN